MWNSKNKFSVGTQNIIFLTFDNSIIVTGPVEDGGPHGKFDCLA